MSDLILWEVAKARLEAANLSVRYGRGDDCMRVFKRPMTESSMPIARISVVAGNVSRYAVSGIINQHGLKGSIDRIGMRKQW